MKRLDEQIHSIEMKFWGKIFGLHCDYYVVQVGLHIVENERLFILDKGSTCRRNSPPGSDRYYEFIIASKTSNIDQENISR